jgi:hypothetical protein
MAVNLNDSTSLLLNLALDPPSIQDAAHESALACVEPRRMEGTVLYYQAGSPRT